MAHIQDRWWNEIIVDDKIRRVKTDLYGIGLRYKVRYIDPGGRERAKSFADKEKHEADAFLVSVEADKLRGTYVDPVAGKVPFREYSLKWLAAQTFDESTRVYDESKLRLQVNPFFGNRSVGSFVPTHIRELDRHLQQRGYSESYRAAIYDTVVSIFHNAVDDGLIAKSPCSARSVRRPRVTPKEFVPWTPAQIEALRTGMPEHHAVSVDLGAGCGLRQGEILGLAEDDHDPVTGLLYVRRQIKMVGSRLVFALPKGRKTRDVPLPTSVADAIKRHVDRFPPLEVTLPWMVPQGKPVTARLLVYGKTRVALDRSTLNESSWYKALAAAGISRGRQHGMHALRHFYASTLLDAGETIKALAKYLGHADPAFTLRTYTHLMPTSEDRTRRAIDAVLRRTQSDASDGL